MRLSLVALVLGLSLLCQAWGKHLLIETEHQHRSVDSNMDDGLGKDYHDGGGDEFIIKYLLYIFSSNISDTLKIIETSWG